MYEFVLHVFTAGTINLSNSRLSGSHPMGRPRS